MKKALIQFVVIVGLMMWFVHWTTVNPSEKKSAGPRQPDELDAHYACKREVIATLKSPQTAEFPGYPEKFGIDDRGNYALLSYVDAQNSFGANLRSRYVCILKLDNIASQWEILDIQME